MASIIYPPTIVHSPNTPAEEWAQQTTAVVNSVGDGDNSKPKDPGATTTTTTTAVSHHEEYVPETSGIPGGYPGIINDYDAERLKESAREALTAASATAQEVYEKAEQTAKEYIPIAQQTVNAKAHTVYETAEQAARQYLPESVVGKLEQVGVLGTKPSSDSPTEHDQRPVPYTSMPTDEVGPFHPTHGGVGTLPGQPTEEGVAKLPDERVEELREELPTREIQSGPTYGGVGSLPGTRSETSIAKLPEERVHDIDQAASSSPIVQNLGQLRDELPSKEVNTGPTYGGVGTLPGSRSESGVAKLPEERNTEAKGSKPSITREPVVAGGAVITGPAGSTENEHVDKNSSLSEDFHGKAPQNIVPLTEGAPAVPAKTGHHVPVDDNNINDIIGQETRGTGAGLHNVEPAKPRTVVVGSGENNDSPSQDAHEKISMSTKLKANAKIIGGKITRDKDLVEEGKSLKTGN